MTICDRFQEYLVTYFKYFVFLFTLAKFDIFCRDISNNCITNLPTKLVHLGLAKFVVVQDGTGSLFFILSLYSTG